MYIIKSQVSA